MSLLDGLKEQLKNPLADNNEEIEFALESDFEVALEKAIDVKLSPADIAAILNGDDDIDDDEDDLDDPDDDIDKDYIKDLEGCKEALESTMTELGIDTAADELDADDSDLEMDPEEDDELSDENTNITAMHYEVESVDYSVLDIGMVDDAMEENTDVVRDYVDFLVNNRIVTFASNLLNGTVLYRIDVLGNELAKVLITMREDEELWAYTDLDFTEFPKKHKSYNRQKFKVIQREEK